MVGKSEILSLGRVIWNFEEVPCRRECRRNQPREERDEKLSGEREALGIPADSEKLRE